MLDHLPGRDVSFAVIARVRCPFVRQVERVVELFGRERRVGRRDDHIAVADGLDQRRCRFHQVALCLDDREILPESPFVARTLLVGVQPDRLRRVEPLHVIFAGHERHLPQFAQQLGIVSVAQCPGDLLYDPFAHAVDQQVGAAFGQHRRLERIAPVVVVRQPPQRGFDSPDYYRDVREQSLDDSRVDCYGIVGPKPRFAAGRIGVVAPEADVGRVVVDHRIHRPGRDAEEEPRRTQLGEVAQVVPPVGLRHDGHAVAFGFEQAADHCRAECRMVDVGVARKEDDVQLLPPACADFLCRGR